MSVCKVLMFGWEFPPQLNGGLGVACHGLTKALSRIENVDVTFVLPKRMKVDATVEKFVFTDTAASKTKSQGIITEVSIRSILEPYSTYDIYTQTLRELGSDCESCDYGLTLFEEVHRYASRTAAYLSESQSQYDVIHCHDWLTIPAALEAKNNLQCPLIIHIHATEVDRTGGQGDQRIYSIEKYGMESADRIIAVSEHTKQTIIKHYGIHQDKITVVHNGIEFHDFKYSKVCEDTYEHLQRLKGQGYQIVLFVGRLTMQKGIEYLLKAAHTIVKHKPKTLFIIAGQGELMNRLIHLSAEYGISENIIFSGWIQGGQRISLYKIADLFIMPSVSEPFGLVSLEAAAFDTPVIVSKTSGAREIIKSAIQTEFWDSDHTAEMIFSVLEYSTLHTILGKESSRESEQATWDKAAQSITSLYHQLQ